MVNGISEKGLSENCDLSKWKDSREAGWYNQGKVRQSHSSSCN